MQFSVSQIRLLSFVRSKSFILLLPHCGVLRPFRLRRLGSIGCCVSHRGSRPRIMGLKSAEFFFSFVEFGAWNLD
jgi:hypothetical protein